MAASLAVLCGLLLVYSLFGKHGRQKAANFRQSTESHLHSAKLEAERAERAKAKSERISSSFSKKLGFRHLQELAWQNSSPCFVSLKIL
jgi:hypothetical protein